MSDFRLKKEHITVTPSKLAMWRCAIAFVHMDGHASNSEMNLIHEYWAAFSFSDDQKVILDSDIREPKDFYAIYPHVTDRLDRTHLINFALVLFNVDGAYTHHEQSFYDDFHQQILQEIDIKKVLEESRKKNLRDSLVYDKKVAEENDGKSFIMRAFDTLALGWDNE